MDKYISIENNCVDYYDYCKKTGINSAKLEENDIVVVPTLCGWGYCFEEQTIDFLRYCREKDSEHKYDILFDGEDILPIFYKRSFDIWMPILRVANTILIPVVVNVVSQYICEWIKGAEHKDLMQRKHFKLDLFDLLQKMKVVLPDEYKNRLLHLDDVQPIENTENAYKEQIDYIRIDEIRLKEHFTISFIRNGFESLISLLKIKHDPKGFAMIAHQIYKSKHFRRGDFNTFSAWYRTFCEIVGCKYCKSYKPSKLKLTEEQEVSFLFLK